MEITRHFTVTTTIVHKNKVLLHFHKSLKKWLPVGGHIDRDELPEEAAVREAKEESGLDIEIYDPDKKVIFKKSKQLIRPSLITLHDINPYHQHIDFAYFATAKTNKLKPKKNETKDLRWFSLKEVECLDMPEDAKIRALKAFGELGEEK
ncbi:MAG: NUDIX domain-containing protein [Parcubacteria group bacterium]|jgi:ADP-ribose pyrophosphatase YjhB (NUDIX family)